MTVETIACVLVQQNVHSLQQPVCHTSIIAHHDTGKRVRSSEV